MRRSVLTGMRSATVWTAALALSALPFVHAHAGIAWPLTGDHAHPPIVHSVFASEEAVHPPWEPELPSHGAAQALASHGLGHEIDSAASATAAPVILGAVPWAGVLPRAVWTGASASSDPGASSSVFKASTAPRAPPRSPLS